MALINFLDVPYDIRLETRNWRNAEEVSKYFQIRYIDEHTHIKWLETLHGKQPKTVAFLIEYAGSFVGVSYFHPIDYKNKLCCWGIYIYRTELRGEKIGEHTLAASLEYAASSLKMKQVYLEVLNDNPAAIRLYKKFGFQCVEKKILISRYVRNMDTITKGDATANNRKIYREVLSLPISLVMTDEETGQVIYDAFIFQKFKISVPGEPERSEKGQGGRRLCQQAGS